MGNNRLFYSYVRSKTKNRVGVGPLKDRSGQLVSENKEMANMLNDYFSIQYSQLRGTGRQRSRKWM